MKGSEEIQALRDMTLLGNEVTCQYLPRWYIAKHSEQSSLPGCSVKVLQYGCASIDAGGREVRNLSIVIDSSGLVLGVPT